MINYIKKHRLESSILISCLIMLITIIAGYSHIAILELLLFTSALFILVILTFKE